jgi:sugar/nucleoside kinase (ribokinase family)
VIFVLGDLLLDLSLRIASFPVRAEDMQLLEGLDLGPGGAANVAIGASRLGLDVGCMGEIGDDLFGRVLLDGLRQEAIDTARVHINPAGRTPVAGVLVDSAGEPAYLGFPGHLTLGHLLPGWQDAIRQAEALFADGWIDSASSADLVLGGIGTALAADVPVFFDPGPGNPRHQRDWLRQAAEAATVVLGTEPQIEALFDGVETREAAARLLSGHAQLVVIKRGAQGSLLIQPDRVHAAPAFPVRLVDATGAGDSLDAAILFGFLRKLPLPDLADLGNAAGAAKVEKWGTGHHLPTRAEIRRVLTDNGRAASYLPD